VTSPIPDRADIVVAGGGIVGLAAAIGFRLSSRSALRVVVVRPEPRVPSADPRGLALVAGSRHLLDALGAWDAIAPHAEAMRRIAIADGRLADVARPFLLGFGEETLPGESFAHVAPADAILAAVAERALTVGVEMRSASVVGLEQVPGASRLALDDDSSLAATLVVAADGKQSALRRLAKIRSHAWSYDQRALVTTLAHSRPHEGRAVQHFLPGGPFALLPMRGNHSSVVWSEEAGEARRIAALSDADFLAELAKRAGSDLGELSLAGPRGSFPLSGMIAREFVADRLALAGDAARVLHPIAGQGVNLGLRDAAAIVETAIDAARLGLDAGGADVLARYQQWRRFESAAFLAATDSLNRLFRIDDPAIRAVRDLGLGLVERSPRLKRSFVRTAAGVSGAVPALVRGVLP
jgi:2-octaprenyl-6-methoxyphenol hydroxylase